MKEEENILISLLHKFILNNTNQNEILEISRKINPEGEIKKFVVAFNNKPLSTNIPKKIHKVFLNDNKEFICNDIKDIAINSWIKCYPNYEVVIYDKNDAIEYLNKYYGDEFVYIYNLLIPLAFKCDFLRLCILYNEGGIYSDIKQYIHKDLDIDFNNYNFVCVEEKHFDWNKFLNIDYPTIQNCFIATVPKHPYIKCAIDLIIQNVLNRYKCMCDIDITGPCMLGCVIHNVKKNWNYYSEHTEKKLYFNKYNFKDKISYVISEHNLNEINDQYKYIIKHKFNDDVSSSNWKLNNELNNCNNYALCWKYNEIYLPVYQEPIVNDENSTCIPYKKYIKNCTMSYVDKSILFCLNSFVLIFDTCQSNQQITSFINKYEYCRTFLTLKKTNNGIKFIINNNKIIKDITNVIDLLSIIHIFIHKIDTILSWDDSIKDSDILHIYNILKNKTNEYCKSYNSFGFLDKEQQSHVILIDKYKKSIPDNSIYVNNIEPFMIYFPQFHTFQENDINYYKDFTDACNLQKLVNSDKVYMSDHKLLTPLVTEKNIEKYTLTDKNIINYQMDILTDYNISGLAMYYYWFSTNNVSGQNMIMKTVIDNVFNSNINGKHIFFIWANECWSKSTALSGTNNICIENNYNETDFINNINNLLIYFKHPSYLKVYNKPVLFIHHPDLIPLNKIELMTNIFNKECINHNFDGITIVLNSMFNKYDDYKCYNHNLNYKYKSEKNIECKYYSENYSNLVVDYEEYINLDCHIKNDEINVYFTDFDNSARLFQPNKLNISTYLVNNTDYNKQIYLNKMVKVYENKKCFLDRILLINGFNEWGENMAFEPSNEFMYYNINLLSRYLIKPIDKIDNVIVLSGGKTGSSTLHSSINNIFNSIHTHDNSHFINNTDTSCKSLFEHIDVNNIKYIFTIYRSTFERKISGFFECFENPNSYNKIYNIPTSLDYDNTNINYIYDLFVNNLLFNDFENYESIFELYNFNNELIPKNFFNYNKKYGVIDFNKQCKIIVLRFLDINLWDDIIYNITNKKIQIINSNLSSKKPYYKLYTQFIKKIKQSKIFLEFINIEKNNLLHNVCISDDDFIQLTQKWC